MSAPSTGRLRRLISPATLAGIATTAILTTPALAGAARTIGVEQGLLSGIDLGKVTAFLGIPYAAPPTGPNRWRAPQPAARWAGVRDARKPGPSCMQAWPAKSFGPYTREFVETPRPDEDCLYLNVWAPTAGRRRLPVLVWIHGGGFASGSGAVPVYDGARLASRGAVVVTVNYRVGPLGFLAHPALSAEATDHVSGNYGLLDQVAALRWVQRNIDRFGGDPKRVTVAGQSAGAASVNSLLLMPAASGLFQRAIAESGAGMGIGSPSLEQAESDGQRFAEYLGAPDAESLRNLPAERIQAAVWSPLAPANQNGPPQILFRPVVDGHTLPTDPQRPESFSAVSVPLITGYTADEVFDPGPRDSAGFEALVRSRYGTHAEALLALYPHSTDAEVADSAQVLARDRYMASLLVWAHAYVRGASRRLYLYSFGKSVPVIKLPSYGAFHTAEVPYVFGNLDMRDRPWRRSDHQLSDAIQATWLEFMKTGVPRVPGGPLWASASVDSYEALAFSDEIRLHSVVSSMARFRALEAFVRDGGTLSLF